MGTGRASGENRACEAAEAAIRSPLLEDVDLQGARGILVNVTAGPDLNIGEFTDVGNIIEEFASSSATVVVGTVIDPEMGDELKVTVVATGLGELEIPSVVVDNSPGQPSPRGDIDYGELDGPAFRRNPSVGSREKPAAPTDSSDANYLDIPAFLRRQAD